jgi:hypothetical protein
MGIVLMPEGVGVRLHYLLKPSYSILFSPVFSAVMNPPTLTSCPQTLMYLPNEKLSMRQTRSTVMGWIGSATKRDIIGITWWLVVGVATDGSTL